MAVKLRLRREGTKKQTHFRVVAADGRAPRDGRFIEIIGEYHPREEPSRIEIDEERALHWLRNGAQPTESVRNLLKIIGVWETFKPGDTSKEDRKRDHAERAAKQAAAQPASRSPGEDGPAEETPEGAADEPETGETAETADTPAGEDEAAAPVAETPHETEQAEEPAAGEGTAAGQTPTDDQDEESEEESA